MGARCSSVILSCRACCFVWAARLYVYKIYRPTQSVMYVPLQVNWFHESILLIVQCRYLKSSSENFYSPESDLPHNIMHYCFITQAGWVFHFHQTTLVCWKWFVPQLYQFRRGISGGPALKYFYMIHRGERLIPCMRHVYIYTSYTHAYIMHTHAKCRYLWSVVSLRNTVCRSSYFSCRFFLSSSVRACICTHAYMPMHTTCV